jgi:NAD dependent epimerase/dehydratase family enzyme
VVDLNRILMWSIDSEDVVGTYNTTGPTPVTNAAFMATLRKVVGRPWSPPVPASVVRIGAWAMQTEPELILTGRRCVPRRLIEQGFTFLYPALDASLADILKSKRS